MTLASGARLGPYEILSPLGAGGMGEVYRARDERLGRDVALKVLPEEFFADPERRARFEREAKLLAALNHPGIAAIYAFDEVSGRHLLAMELVSGETLEARLARGPMPVDESLEIAARIAEALEAAHERGIVHRDLKPANVKLSADGRVKVLDFGLAKALGDDPSASGQSGMTQSPTLTARATVAGMILGTASYMSPEQARGKPVDRRTDIWAFGCVLFECLAGKKVFEEDTVSDILAAILTKQPDYSLLPGETPPLVRRVLRKCLERDARLRLHDVADARLDLEEAAAGLGDGDSASAEPFPTARRSSSAISRLFPWAIAALALGAALLLWKRPPAHSAPSIRAQILVAPESELMEEAGAAVLASPDGSRIAFVVRKPRHRLFVRSLDRLDAIEIPDSDGAESVAFSPDGASIAFISAGKLRRVSVTGGPPVTICAAQSPRGVAWISPDTIVLTPRTSGGLALVSAAGGEPKTLTTPNGAVGERSHRWPSPLPGGRSALFMTQLGGADYDDGVIEAVDVSTGKRTVLLRGGSFPRYSPSGHLLFVRKGTLFAAPMDPSKPALTGRPMPVVENLLASTGAEAPSDGSAQFDVSASGVAVYRTGRPETTFHLAILDRKGMELRMAGPPRGYARPRISPDGTRVAVVVGGQSVGDIWVYDIARDSFQRLTFEGTNWSPVWTPDGRSLAYSSNRGQRLLPASEGGVNVARGIFVRQADGSGPEHLLFRMTGLLAATGISADGRFLVFDFTKPETQLDVAVARLDDSGAVVGEPRPVVESPMIDMNGSVSFDGRWLAYESGEAGRAHIYLRSMAGGDSKWEVSADPGTSPRWTRDGRLHFLRDDGSIAAISVADGGGAPVFGKEERVLTLPSLESGSRTLALNGWDLSADGTRFVALKRDVAANAVDVNHVVLVSDFARELRRLAPSDDRIPRNP